MGIFRLAFLLTFFTGKGVAVTFLINSFTTSCCGAGINDEFNSSPFFPSLTSILLPWAWCF